MEGYEKQRGGVRERRRGKRVEEVMKITHLIDENKERTKKAKKRGERVRTKPRIECISQK